MRAAVPAEWLATVRSLRTIDAATVIPGHGFIENGRAMNASLSEFEQALAHIIAEATRLFESGVSVEAAVRQANWGRYASWTASDRNAPVAIQRVYDALAGKLP
jgi:hypothetical protein